MAALGECVQLLRETWQMGGDPFPALAQGIVDGSLALGAETNKGNGRLHCFQSQHQPQQEAQEQQHKGE